MVSDANVRIESALTDQVKESLLAQFKERLTEITGVDDSDDAIAKYLLFMVENKKTVEEICTSMVDFLEEDKMSVFSSWISVLLSELKNQLEVLPKKQTRRVAGIVQPTTSGSRVVSLKPSSVDADSLKKRKERFGLENPSVDDEIVKKRRAERFKIQKEETKKQKKDVSSLLGPPVTKEQAQLDVKDAEDQVRLSIQKNRGSIPRPPPAPASGIYYPPLPAGYPNYMCYPPYHHGYGGRPPRGRGGNWAAWNNDPSYGIPSAHQHQGGYNYPRHPRPVFANKTWVREEQDTSKLSESLPKTP